MISIAERLWKNLPTNNCKRYADLIPAVHHSCCKGKPCRKKKTDRPIEQQQLKFRSHAGQHLNMTVRKSGCRGVAIELCSELFVAFLHDVFPRDFRLKSSKRKVALPSGRGKHYTQKHTKSHNCVRIGPVFWARFRCSGIRIFPASECFLRVRATCIAERSKISATLGEPKVNQSKNKNRTRRA